MNYIGVINDIEKPKVTVNGVRAVSVSIENQVGEIATCSILLKPEDVTQFMAPDTEVKVEVMGESGSSGGSIFEGYVSGVNMSHMGGKLSAGIDVVHRDGRNLNETSSLVPGNVPGGNVDANCTIWRKSGAMKGDEYVPNKEFLLAGKSFGEGLIDGIVKWIESQKPSRSIGFEVSDAGEKDKAISTLKKIEDLCGELNVPSELFVPINNYIHMLLSRGASTSTIWDMLSIICGAFDAILICKPDGSLSISPNFAAIQSQGAKIPSEIIQKFDRSSLMKRAPKECLIVGSVSTDSVRNSAKPNVVGKYVSDMPGLRGTLMLSVPGWANDMSQRVSSEARQKALNTLAEANILRFAHKEKTFNLITPPCPGVTPGICAKFMPASKLKNFEGKNVKIFEEEFDGYCYKIQHLFEVNNFCTVFWFSTALETSKYTKPSSHPLFKSGRMLTWK